MVNGVVATHDTRTWLLCVCVAKESSDDARSTSMCGLGRQLLTASMSTMQALDVIMSACRPSSVTDTKLPSSTAAATRFNNVLSKQARADAVCEHL